MLPALCVKRLLMLAPHFTALCSEIIPRYYCVSPGASLGPCMKSTTPKTFPQSAGKLSRSRTRERQSAFSEKTLLVNCPSLIRVTSSTPAVSSPSSRATAMRKPPSCPPFSEDGFRRKVTDTPFCGGCSGCTSIGWMGSTAANGLARSQPWSLTGSGFCKRACSNRSRDAGRSDDTCDRVAKMRRDRRRSIGGVTGHH